MLVEVVDISFVLGNCLITASAIRSFIEIMPCYFAMRCNFFIIICFWVGHGGWVVPTLSKVNMYIVCNVQSTLAGVQPKKPPDCQNSNQKLRLQTGNRSCLNSK